MKHSPIRIRSWLTPVILAIQEAEIRRTGLKSAPANNSTRTYLKKTFMKIGLVEWLKVKALNSSPSTARKKE
jgi:hypothetical protein